MSETVGIYGFVPGRAGRRKNPTPAIQAGIPCRGTDRQTTLPEEEEEGRKERAKKRNGERMLAKCAAYRAINNAEGVGGYGGGLSTMFSPAKNVQINSINFPIEHDRQFCSNSTAILETVGYDNRTIFAIYCN